MKSCNAIIALILLIFTFAVRAAEVVTYCEDTILSTDDDSITLLGGSTWSTTGNTFLMLLEDVIIIQSSATIDGQLFEFHELYSDGNTIIVNKVTGECSNSIGRKAKVIRELNGGRTLILDDNTVLNFDSYDSFDTGFWLPPYEILITANELYMWNLRKGKRVWIQSVE